MSSLFTNQASAGSTLGVMAKPMQLRGPSIKQMENAHELLRDILFFFQIVIHDDQALVATNLFLCRKTAPTNSTFEVCVKPRKHLLECLPYTIEITVFLRKVCLHAR